MQNALGIDTGVDGALVCIFPNGQIKYWDNPVFKSRGQSTTPDNRAMDAILKEIGGGVALVESVHIRPDEIGGVRKAEVLIRNHQAWLTLLETNGYGVIQMEPSEWRSKLKLVGKSKPELLTEAIKRFPQCRSWLKYPYQNRTVVEKFDRAEALLMSNLARQLMMEVAA